VLSFQVESHDQVSLRSGSLSFHRALNSVVGSVPIVLDGLLVGPDGKALVLRRLESVEGLAIVSLQDLISILALKVQEYFASSVVHSEVESGELNLGGVFDPHFDVLVFLRVSSLAG